MNCPNCTNENKCWRHCPETTKGVSGSTLVWSNSDNEYPPKDRLFIEVGATGYGYFRIYIRYRYNVAVYASSTAPTMTLEQRRAFGERLETYYLSKRKQYPQMTFEDAGRIAKSIIVLLGSPEYLGQGEIE